MSAFLILLCTFVQIILSLSGSWVMSMPCFYITSAVTCSNLFCVFVALVQE